MGAAFLRLPFAIFSDFLFLLRYLTKSLLRPLHDSVPGWLAPVIQSGTEASLTLYGLPYRLIKAAHHGRDGKACGFFERTIPFLLFRGFSLPENPPIGWGDIFRTRCGRPFTALIHIYAAADRLQLFL